MLPSVNMVLVSLVSSYVDITLMGSNPRPRAHADVVVITLNDNLVSTATTMSLVVSMMVLVVVIVPVIAMFRVGKRGSSTDTNVVIISFDDHNVVGVLRTMMAPVMMVMVAVAWIRGRGRGGGTTVKSDVAICPVDVDERSRATILRQLLCCCRLGAMLVCVMCFVMGRVSPRQKRR